MKAWLVFHDDSWCLMVFAETRNRAKALASEKGPCDMPYVECRAVRLPDYDVHASSEQVMVTNDDLPDGAPDYWEDECETY